jgi:uncharacterized membrane protein YkoI
MKRTNVILVSGLAAALVVGGGAATIVAAQDDPPAPAGDLRGAGTAARDAVGGGDVLSVERDDDSDGYEVEIRRTDGTEVDVDLSATFEVLRTEDDDVDDDAGEAAAPAVPGDLDLSRAADAALATAGDGTVTDVEWDDGGYDVEIRTAEGRELDVRLDRGFTVVQTEEDVED